MPDQEEGWTYSYVWGVTAYILEDMEEKDYTPRYRAPIAYR